MHVLTNLCYWLFTKMSTEAFESFDTCLTGKLFHRAVTILEEMALFNYNSYCGEKLFLTDSKKMCSALDMKR